MKKLLMILPVIFITACSSFVESKNGADTLIELDGAPENCTFSYKIKTSVAVYSKEDAIRYLRNTIVDNDKPGNAFWIVTEKTELNEGAIFGPDETFIMNTNIYNCPEFDNIKK